MGTACVCRVFGTGSETPRAHERGWNHPTGDGGKNSLLKGRGKEKEGGVG